MQAAMHRRVVFALIFVASTLLLVILSSALYIMGYSMEKLMQYSYGGDYFPMFLIMGSFFAIILMAVFGVAGLAASLSAGRQDQSAQAGFEAIYASLMPDEKKVVDCLTKRGGRCLQRDITRETGFTRLKTYRVVSRLQQRKVVTVTPSGKTNVVELAPWMTAEKSGQESVATRAIVSGNSSMTFPPWHGSFRIVSGNV
ncbi:MAG: helix-turn-helix transcriptional regulator [Thermoprotei archaeon]|nr:hypothetical protein [TACK group archaeon]